jgi:hypothetical protein
VIGAVRLTVVLSVWCTPVMDGMHGEYAGSRVASAESIAARECPQRCQVAASCINDHTVNVAMPLGIRVPQASPPTPLVASNSF